MDVSQLCSRELYVVGCDEPLAHVVREMQKRSIGAAVVVTQSRRASAGSDQNRCAEPPTMCGCETAKRSAARGLQSRTVPLRGSMTIRASSPLSKRRSRLGKPA